MKHDFTDQQIVDAFEDAELAGDWKAFRSFLDALPEPSRPLPDSKADINKAAMATGWRRGYNSDAGDLVNGIPLTEMQTFLAHLRNLDADSSQDDWQLCAFEDIQKGDRVKWVHQEEDREQVITGIAHRLAYGDEAWVTESNLIIADISVEGQFYRIPAPVVHPDPTEHPVVIDGNGTSWFWSGTGDEYHSPEFPGTYKDRFTSWTPGEVVPKVVADDD